MTVEPFRMLCSYAYFRTRDMAEVCAGIAGPLPMVFADSGAHSARTLGIHLTLEDYGRWCQRWAPHLTVISNLDVIGAPQATYNNQKRLEREFGLAPLPVFHTGEDWRWLQRYLDEGYRYIALGKLLGNPIPAVLSWLDKAFALADGRAVFHGFGMTVWDALRRFAFYSVDSSSWGAAFRYGRVQLFDDRKGRWVAFRLRDRAEVLRHRELIRAHGADPTILVSQSTYDRRLIAGMSAVAFRRAEQYLRARHGPISLPGRPGGLHIHLAESNATHLTNAASGLHLYLAETVPRTIRHAASAIAVRQEPTP